jgi:multiple sugar transport system permease protein
MLNPPLQDGENAVQRYLKRAPAVPFLAPTVIFLALLTLYPFVYSVILSTTRRNLARPGQSGFVGFDNYAELFTHNLFQTALLQTLIVAVASIALELAIGFFVARLFFSLADLPAANLLRTVYILPMMLTPVVSGLLWSYILNPTLGIANYLLGLVGLPPFGWFSSSKTALATLVLVNAWQWGPFLMLLMLAGLLSIPAEQYEAAQLDGARWHQAVRFIELPALRNVVLIGVILRLIDNFRLFDVVYAATKGGPGDATEVVSMYAFRQMFQFFNIGYGSAAAVVILFVGIVITTIAVRFLRREELNAR